MPGPRGLVRDQHVDPTKLARARQLRRAMTPPERRLWAELRKNRLAGLHFRRQQIADGFVLDFYCHEVGLVVEIDGPIHVRQADYDAARTQWLQAKGLRVIRFTNAQVEHDLAGVLAQIHAACRP